MFKNKTGKFDINKFIGTFFGVGLIPFAPGTFGTIAAIPFIWLINKFILHILIPDVSNATVEGFIMLLIFHLFFIVFLFIIGTFCSSSYVKEYGKEDPKEIVIDEVVGMWLLILITTPGALILYKKFNMVFENHIYVQILIIFTMFILFRLFDIFKPWPISWFDQKVKGGIGIMLDDVVAAIMGSVIFYILVSYL